MAERTNTSAWLYGISLVLAVLWAVAFGTFAVAFSCEYPPLDGSPWGVYGLAVLVSIAPLASVLVVRRWRLPPRKRPRPAPGGPGRGAW